MFKEVFITTLSQMSVLFIFILIGYVLKRMNLIKQDAIKTLSKLVSTVFLPLVLLKSFMTSFTVDALGDNAIIILVSLIVMILTVLIGMGVGKLLIKDDDYLKKMVQYGLIYSNFAYMGIPIVVAINASYEAPYLIFTIVPQFFFTLWAIPSLLVPKKEGEKESVSSYLKRLFNPIFVCLILGVLLGLTGLGTLIKDHVPFIYSAISSGAACMSPIAMILTGVVIASYNILPTLKNVKLYITSLLRVIAIPGFIVLLFVLANNFISFEETMYQTLLVCTLAYLAMPLGLNSIIIPASFGCDVIDCAGMTLISSVISLITIPILFALFLSI